MFRSKTSSKRRGCARAYRVFAAAVAAALALQAAPASAGQGGATAEEVGIGAASGALTLLYAPVKLVYSALGLVIGGLAYGLSAGDPDVANAVLTPAIRGDYVVTPAHLRGERRLEFFGRDPDYDAGYVSDSR